MKKFLLPLFLLLSMFFLAFFSIKDDSLTFDEPAHIGAGYSYLIKKDYRLNPEHPPLAKDIAALPLLFLKLQFPEESENWKQTQPAEWWVQFNFGKEFLYQLNTPEKIIFWTKFAMILFTIFTGFTLFFLTKKFFDYLTALFTLFFFSFSPTFLAHGRLVTTDVAASLGVILSTFSYLRFLYFPSLKNLILVGLALGFALLTKFSLILLLPYFFSLSLLWGVLNKNFFRFFGSFFLILLVAFFLVILPVYQFHILNYPPERQYRDILFNLEKLGVPFFIKKINLSLAQNSFLRPLGEYLLGLSMAINRTAGGNTMFFLGEVSAEGWRYYFPIVFLLKEPLALHILIFFVFFFSFFQIKKEILNSFQNSSIAPRISRILSYLKVLLLKYFTPFSLFLFLLIYLLTSLASKLNLGVRHLLPSFPFLYILVSWRLVSFLKKPHLKIKYFFLALLLLWQIFSVIKIYPHFLAYFNEIIGGPQYGYLYTTDSNLDWGQDLKRLSQWVEKNKIEKIYVDYFGGGIPEYYLKERYRPWNSSFNPNQLEKPAFLAVSASFLQGGRALPGKKFNQKTDFYYWLYQYEPPVAKIGYSIFVYFIPK